MMKKFKTPEIEINAFDVEDVITTSTEEIPPEVGEDGTGWA